MIILFFVICPLLWSTGGPSCNSDNALARGRTDICATAISNANLNLNDFLDDTSIGQ